MKKLKKIGFSERSNKSHDVMEEAIMSGKTNGVICQCMTYPERSWVKWFDDSDDCFLFWITLLNNFNAKFAMSYPKEFTWEDGTPDPGDYAMAYNKREEPIYFLHIINERYEDIDQKILDYALGIGN